MSEKEERRESMFSFRNFVMTISALVVIIAVTAAVYFYMQFYQAQQLLKNPTMVAQQQTDQLVSQVGKLMELPKGEQPTVATVSDVTKLKDQPFFQDAKNGDKVLIYTKAKKAILYRPSENKIIDVAPVNIGANEAAPVSPKPTIKVTPTTKPTVAPTEAQ